MRVDEKFKKQSAKLISCQQPVVRGSVSLALGMSITIHPAVETVDDRNFTIHLTPQEALQLAEDLVRVVKESTGS
jgi:hypothetical protein